MAEPMETFVSNTHYDFPWPNDVPLLAVPSAPPKNTGKRFYLPRSDPDDCKCDYHSYDSDIKRYKELIKEEGKLCKNITKINHEMNGLLQNILESECKSEEESMKSIYQIAYDKKNNPIAKYRPLMASVDSSVGAPIKPAISEVKDGYRDPMKFRYSQFEIPHIEPPKPVDFTRVPDTFLMWSKQFQGRTEYMDTISKMGNSNMKNQQQYLEPLPSSRRRRGDCDI